MSRIDLSCRIGDVTPLFPTLELTAPVECQEIENAFGDRYVRCARPASALIYHAADRRTYPMCDTCAAHNEHNRAGVRVAELRHGA